MNKKHHCNRFFGTFMHHFQFFIFKKICQNSKSISRCRCKKGIMQSKGRLFYKCFCTKDTEKCEHFLHEKALKIVLNKIVTKKIWLICGILFIKDVKYAKMRRPKASRVNVSESHLRKNHCLKKLLGTLAGFSIFPTLLFTNNICIENL